MIFQVRRDGKTQGSCGFFEPGRALDEVLAGMIAGETITVTPQDQVDEGEPPPSHVSREHLLQEGGDGT